MPNAKSWGRVGGLRKAARFTPEEGMAAARAAYEAKIREAANVDPQLPPEERERRHKAFRRAHYVALGIRAAEARWGPKAREATTAAAQAQEGPNA